MREIKFRVWSKQKQEMIYPDKFGWFQKVFIGNNGFLQDIQLGTALELNGTKLELQQYTGLKDKSGKDIYEGDIVKREFELYERNWEGSPEEGDLSYTEEISDSGYFIGVVHFRPSEGYVLNKCHKFDDEGNLLTKKSGVKLYSKYAEVIGNIYEDGDLLEKANS